MEVLKNNKIKVRNAGIVILNQYIKMLFERLDLLKDNQSFKDIESQKKATLYLQYVATGITSTEDIYLPLNKVLCGLSINDTVPEEIEISEHEFVLINGLMAAISHWPEVGRTSVNGFRGNWLVRDGLLVEQEDKWELNIEKRAYDILIHKSPFSFSIIKYHWMKKPLHVIWPY